MVRPPDRLLFRFISRIKHSNRATGTLPAAYSYGYEVEDLDAATGVSEDPDEELQSKNKKNKKQTGYSGLGANQCCHAQAALCNSLEDTPNEVQESISIDVHKKPKKQSRGARRREKAREAARRASSS